MRLSVCQKLIFALLVLLLSIAMPVFAADDSLEALGIIEKSTEPLVTTSRTPRPISKIAENTTIITSEEITRLNAHTLADVLQTVPGIQLDYNRTPTTFTMFNVQGAHNHTVLVLIDGIRQNDFDQNFATPGMIPVQQIERIEIIKGSASASWGPALGGVINIITKTPNSEQPYSGMLSSSYGTKRTTDTRVEMSGTASRIGYYLTYANLGSEGLTPNSSTNMNSLYGKLSYTTPGNGTLSLGLSHQSARPGLDEGETARWGWVHDNNEYRRNNGFLKFNQPIGTKLNLDIDGYFTNRDDHTKYGGRDAQGAIEYYNDYTAWNSGRGANMRLTWGDSQQNLVIGSEFAHIDASFRDKMSLEPPVYDKTWTSWALYGNGAYTLGQLTMLPGIRLDHTGISDSNASYTLGSTYQLTEKTILRAYGAKGFTLPTPYNHSGNFPKIKTMQVGIESETTPYLWFKGTYFYNSLNNSESLGVTTITNQKRQGFEIEARTTPVFNFSLTGGYTYLYTKNSDTGERLQTDSNQTVPPHIVKLALNYNNAELGLRGTLTGNYVWWNSPADGLSQSSGMIWDLLLNWKLKPISGLSPELFFSGHNLFNGIQTTDTTLYTNPTRWYEGGLRVNF